METTSSLPTPPPLPASGPPTTSVSSSNVRIWNALCYASALLGVFLHFPGHLLGPLIVWLIKRGESREINAHGKESLNFQISMIIYNIVSAVFCQLVVDIVYLTIIRFFNSVSV